MIRRRCASVVVGRFTIPGAIFKAAVLCRTGRIDLALEKARTWGPGGRSQWSGRPTLPPVKRPVTHSGVVVPGVEKSPLLALMQGLQLGENTLSAGALRTGAAPGQQASEQQQYGRCPVLPGHNHGLHSQTSERRVLRDKIPDLCGAEASGGQWESDT